MSSLIGLGANMFQPCQSPSVRNGRSAMRLKTLRNGNESGIDQKTAQMTYKTARMTLKRCTQTSSGVLEVIGKIQEMYEGVNLWRGLVYNLERRLVSEKLCRCS